MDLTKFIEIYLAVIQEIYLPLLVINSLLINSATFCRFILHAESRLRSKIFMCHHHSLFSVHAICRPKEDCLKHIGFLYSVSR